jgi:hypothetical protein
LWQDRQHSVVVEKEGKRMGRESQQASEQVLGYLNFSAGASDPRLLASLNQLWAEHAGTGGGAVPQWQRVGAALQADLRQLAVTSPAFRDVQQAEAALQHLLEGVLPGYWEFHQDLLFHQAQDGVVNAFFFGRACEATVRQAGFFDDRVQVTRRAIRELNDFIGYRPVAVLEGRRIEPYPHEWVGLVPLYVRDAGFAWGPWRELLELALQILRQTDPDLLQLACFDPQLVDEIALDPRAYDFDHPVNKRPNYHFGLWDPHRLDQQGRYRRYVIQQVTLDAIMSRLEQPSRLRREEELVEAAAVLVGTMLMATGVSGRGPDTHDSNTTLSSLLPRIAGYRDEFYERLIERLPLRHRQRLQRERMERRQPFGAARQQLNAQLARRRASQLEHVQLAKLFSRMGYPDAATSQVARVPTASARLMCEIDCRLMATQEALDRGDIQRVVSLLAEVVERLHRAIGCGAVVDPWNILGFDSHFSLFPALENSVHDHRVDELVAAIDLIFGFYARAWSRAAAADDEALATQIRAAFQALGSWWRQFAAHQVTSVQAADAEDAFQAAEHVARAIQLWHQGGAGAGDVGFWAPHAAMFDSPRAYALVIEALLEQKDFVAAQALLIHWLGAADRIRLEQGEYSFHRLVERWLIELREASMDAQSFVSPATWKQIQKLFDYLEANAEDYWHVPTFELGNEDGKSAGNRTARGPGHPLEDGFDKLSAAGSADEEEEEERELFDAAYEDMVYRDSTDDGVEGAVFDKTNSPVDELSTESERLSDRLAFLTTLARLWKSAALTQVHDPDEHAIENRLAAMRNWSDRASQNRMELQRLIAAIDHFAIPDPTGDHDSMLEYDRRRVVKDSLLERLIDTSVETTSSARLLAAAVAAKSPPLDTNGLTSIHSAADREEKLMVEAFAAVLSRDVKRLRCVSPFLLRTLIHMPLLYVPLTRGGSPHTIIHVRVRQREIQGLQKCLPRLGLYLEAGSLLETARLMERDNPVGPGAVTEFDDLFKTGFRSMVECLVASSETWSGPEDDRNQPAHADLVACLEQLAESLLGSWLSHSRTLRLSVLEKVSEQRSWRKLVAFIERYGNDLFTQRFLYLGNVRAILHQGVENWLQMIQQDSHPELQIRLVEELNDQISLTEAAELLTLVLEAIVENYGEYRDYNSTTTQSDRGEMLYTLLDFLRLRAKYDRVCWNLKPVVLAHQILVRRGRKRAAQLWRRALRERICDEAEKYQKRLAVLQKKYAMQMPSIADRIGERFVRALVIDRLCALVRPAVAEARSARPKRSFRVLELQTEFLTREPSGVGFDVPAWLVALEDEVERVRLPDWLRDDYDELITVIPIVPQTREEVGSQLERWSETKTR